MVRATPETALADKPFQPIQRADAPLAPRASSPPRPLAAGSCVLGPRAGRCLPRRQRADRLQVRRGASAVPTRTAPERASLLASAARPGLVAGRERRSPTSNGRWDHVANADGSDSGPCPRPARSQPAWSNDNLTRRVRQRGEPHLAIERAARRAAGHDIGTPTDPASRRRVEVVYALATRQRRRYHIWSTQLARLGHPDAVS